MALEYTLTETLTPDEYKNSWVNFYRQVLGMGGTYGDEGGGGGGGDTFTPQQTTVSYSSADDTDEVNIDNFKIATVDPTSIDSLPDLDLEGADKPDRLNIFEIGNNPTLRDKILKNSEKFIQQGVPAIMGFTGGVPALAATAGITSLAGGSSYIDEAGNTQFRPDGFLGALGDFARQQRRAKPQAIQAGPIDGDRGTAFTVGNMMIVRGPGDTSYTGNRQGLSFKQLKNIEALQKGILPETFRFDNTSDGKTAIFTGGKKVNQSILEDGGVLIDPNDPTKGFYRGDGAIYSLRFGYAPRGYESDLRRLADNYDITFEEARDAVFNARQGNGTVSSNIRNLSDKSRTISTQRVDNKRLAPTVAGRASQLEAERERVARLAREQAQRQRDNDADKERRGFETFRRAQLAGIKKEDELQGIKRRARESRGGTEDATIEDDAFNRGGFIGMNVGGLTASKSGFVDGVPPSQTTDAQEVADDRPTQLPEGAYVINASAVTFAGETDIINMLREAQEEAVRRGVAPKNPNTSSMIDVAVSRGEVVVAPYLVNIIGKDRLEKINNRGIKDTERKIEENGQRVQGAATGGPMGQVAQAPIDGYEYQEAMTSISAGVARALGVFEDVNKSIAVSKKFREMYSTEDNIEDTLRHILLGGLTASVEDDNFLTKGQRGIAKFLIDDVREKHFGDAGFNPESDIDLNNNAYGRALRRKFPDKDRFTRAAVGAALLFQEGDAFEVDGLVPQLSTVTGRE